MTSKLKCPVSENLDDIKDMRCPFCNKLLDAVVKNKNDWIYNCGNPECQYFDDAENYNAKHYLATAEFWEELIRTKKKYERAMWWLKEIVENHRCTPISTAEMALKELDDEQ